MGMWNNLGLTRKMALFIGAMLLVIGLLSGRFLLTINQLSGQTNSLKEQAAITALMLAREIDHLVWLNNLQKYVLDQGSGVAMTLQTDPTRCGLGQWFYGEGKKNAVAQFPHLAAELAKMEAPHNALHQSAIRIRQLRENGDNAGAVQVYRDVSEPSVKVVQEVLRNVIAMMNAGQNQASKAFVESVQTSTRIAIALCLFGLTLAILMGILIARTVTQPIVRLAEQAGIIAGGKLDINVSMNRKDEIGGLSAALQHMINSIKGMIAKADEKTKEAEASSAKALEAMQAAEAAQRAAERAKAEGMLAAAGQLEGVVNAIDTASRLLSEQVRESERGADAQAARVGETATAMDEMTSTILEVARTAGTASEFSAKTKEKAGQGATVVKKAVSSIQNVHTVSIAMKSDIARLADQAESVSHVMGVISDIADQTNLLALNAAIEAARAGEAGRGFAVVADEVRKLAEKTMASTADVGKSISSIQKSVSDSIGQVEKVVSLIQTATEEASQSGEVLSEIVTMADGAAGQVQAIAAASEEQSATCEEINRAITEINTIAHQTTTAMNEANSAVSQMAGQVDNMNNLIAAMKKS